MKVAFIIILLLFSYSVRAGYSLLLPESGDLENFSDGTIRVEIIRYAKELLGTPYRIANSNPHKGFDCSGFVNYVFKKFKISLPRSSAAFEKLGTALKPEEFKAGDILVFYGFKNRDRIGHIGIVCEADGLNSKFIHSSSGKAHCVTISELGSEMYKARFYKCINVID